MESRPAEQKMAVVLKVRTGAVEMVEAPVFDQEKIGEVAPSNSLAAVDVIKQFQMNLARLEDLQGRLRFVLREVNGLTKSLR